MPDTPVTHQRASQHLPFRLSSDQLCRECAPSHPGSAHTDRPPPHWPPCDGSLHPHGRLWLRQHPLPATLMARFPRRPSGALLRSPPLPWPPIWCFRWRFQVTELSFQSLDPLVRLSCSARQVYWPHRPSNSERKHPAKTNTAEAS